MATQSIKKNIVISDEQSATAFVEALEKAEAISTKSNSCGYEVTELKGAARIKAFFGRQIIMEYIQLNILELLDIYGEEQLNERLSNFICPKNKDVEDFIQHKAIEFAKQRVAISHLVFSKTDSPVLLGYFTLANKFISITGNTLSKTLQKKISKFSQYDQELERHIVSMPLIAQLGKNFAPEAIGKIAGKTLLDMACNKVQEAQFMIGGKAVYIECANSDKLHDFYTDSQFVSFGQRQCDKDEFMEETILVQMLKYFKN